MFSKRGESLSRHFMQCVPSENLDAWPDALIWDELTLRLGGARRLARGKILQKSYTPMRGFVTEPMQSGRLFIAGDAAHIVPPTGAKGMNLAAADVRVLAAAFADHFNRNDEIKLHNYSDTCLRRIWQAQSFSWWLTGLLHSDVHRHTFNLRRQSAEIDYLTTSRAAMASFAENFCGLPFD
jgi:p-hydroxybenzoate 3-monooxygenase